MPPLSSSSASALHRQRGRVAPIKTSRGLSHCVPLLHCDATIQCSGDTAYIREAFYSRSADARLALRGAVTARRVWPRCGLTTGRGAARSRGERPGRGVAWRGVVWRGARPGLKFSTRGTPPGLSPPPPWRLRCGWSRSALSHYRGGRSGACRICRAHASPRIDGLLFFSSVGLNKRQPNLYLILLLQRDGCLTT